MSPLANYKSITLQISLRSFNKKLTHLYLTTNDSIIPSWEASNSRSTTLEYKKIEYVKIILKSLIYYNSFTYYIIIGALQNKTYGLV